MIMIKGVSCSSIFGLFLLRLVRKEDSRLGFLFQDLSEEGAVETIFDLINKLPLAFIVAQCADYAPAEPAPVLSAVDVSREFGINYRRLLREMKKTFNLEIKLERKRAKYYDAIQFREWLKSSGLID